MKKFTTILMTCLIMLVVVLTGCSTFKIDKVKYYNEVLAKVGNENITRFDLINAYNSYGYTNFVTQQGKSEKEALLETMDLLVQRKLVVQHAKDNTDKYSLTHYEVKKLYRDTLDSLLENLNSYKDSARKIYDLEEPESSETSAESEDAKKLSDYFYQKRVKVESFKNLESGETEYQLKYVDTDTEKDEHEIQPSLDEDYIDNFKSYSQNKIVKALLARLQEEFYENKYDEDDIIYTKVCDKAIELACNSLKNYEYYLREDGNKLSTKNYDLMYRFVNRAYESQLESAYITKVNNVYLKTETLSNDSIIKAYKALYESDYAKYVNDAAAYNSKITATDADLIYYTPNSDAKFGYFLHVLLPLNNVEEELKWLKEHRHMYSDEEYQAEQMALINQITCAQRSTSEIRDDETGEIVYNEGVVMEGEVPFLEVLEEYNTKVNNLGSFIEFMFKYSTDTATLTADMPYVIGYNTVTDEAYSAMVTNFTNEAIRLMKANQQFTYSDQYILTNYGVHLLYYMGPVGNQISIEDLNRITVDSLGSAVLNQATGETYLDRVFDLVYPASSNGMFTSSTKYSSYEQVLIDSLYAKYPVELYETKIKASNKI